MCCYTLYQQDPINKLISTRWYSHIDQLVDQLVNNVCQTRLSMRKCRWHAKICVEKSSPLPPLLHPINLLIGCVKLIPQWQSVDERRGCVEKSLHLCLHSYTLQCVSYQLVDRVCQTRLSTTKCRRHTMVWRAKSPPLPPLLYPINKLIGCVKFVSRWHSVDDTCGCVKKSLHLCLYWSLNPINKLIKCLELVSRWHSVGAWRKEL